MYHRGISTPEKQKQWLKADWGDMYDWQDLDDSNKMQRACNLLADCIDKNKTVQIVVDADSDGWNATAILINYLYSRFPAWTSNYCTYIFHRGKAHGLSDIMDEIKCDLLISPDGGTNDWTEQMELTLHRNTQVIILDHHLIDNIEIVDTTPAIIINVQNSYYPNKALTGGGVVYRFISAFEELYVHGSQPIEFMDLCAVANIGDMADYREPEIRAIVKEGLSNIKNPFLHEICKQHQYTLNKRNGLNYLSVAFAVVPFINALTRSGTPEEQEAVFKGMLTQYAFDKVDSSKRGAHEQVYRYQEAVTIANRVKRRQDKIVNETMEKLDRKIQEQHLTDNAILLLLCEPDEIEANHCGLIANKCQAKYQHPTLVLRKTKNKDDKEYFYRGSCRNYSFCVANNLKEMLEKTGDMEFVAGHNNAAGCGIAESKVQDFIKHSNELYKDIDFTPTYMVDFIWKPYDLNIATVLQIAELDIWGQEMPQATIVIEDIPLSEDNVQILGLAKGKPTLKINCYGIELMRFGSSEEEYERFIQPNTYLTVVGTCSKNIWQDVVKPQILIDDFELQQKWIF